MSIAEAREQQLARVKKNLKLVVVALVVLAIEKIIDMVANVFTGSEICGCANTTIEMLKKYCQRDSSHANMTYDSHSPAT